MLSIGAVIFGILMLVATGIIPDPVLDLGEQTVELSQYAVSAAFAIFALAALLGGRDPEAIDPYEFALAAITVGALAGLYLEWEPLLDQMASLDPILQIVVVSVAYLSYWRFAFAEGSNG